MSSVHRSESWTTVALDALWWLRPMAWAVIAFALWFAVVAPAQADPLPFPFPPPNTGCPPNSSCIPGGFPGGGNPGQCTSNPNGDPGCNGAGNPVDIITGNKYQHEIDLAPLPGEMGLHFSRHYNSNSTHRGLTGVGWRSSYEVVLVDLGSAVQIIDADGRRLTFDRHSNQPSLCIGARPEDGRVIVDEGGKEASDRRASSAVTKAGGLTYRWQRLDGSEYLFSGGSGEGHPLQSIRAASGATMTLTYLGGALDNVRDAQGRILRFIYARATAAGSTRHRMLTLSAIDTPVGRVTYKHDEFGRLQAAIQPNGLVHRYHYESERQGAPQNTWALTGISAESVQDGKASTMRLATYAYDTQARAVRTQHAGGDDLTLTYGPKASTTITTAAGARTIYRHALVAGQWKTVEAIGPGCGTCPSSNVRYRYRIDGPRAGELEATLRLDAQGKPLQQERVAVDAWGRPTRVERISYRSEKTSVRSQKPELFLRAQYEPMPQNLRSAELTAAQYATLWRPKIVARPSVVAGREHTIAFTYNAHLQPVTKTEAGASPLDAGGSFVATGLTRTTTYRYAQIAGASRLIAVDGPIPGRTDTRTFHYDERGRLSLVQHPVRDLQERFAYDAAGRVALYIPTDAVPVRTRYPDDGHTLANEPMLPASIERAARTTQYQYNLRGWVVHWSDSPLRSVSLAYNSEGRVTEARDAQGNRVTWSRDEAKRLEATLWFDSGQANAAAPSPQRGYYRWFDQAERTIKTLAADGRSDEYLYDAQGRLTQHLDGDGIAHLYRARVDSAGGTTQARIDLAPGDEVRLFMSHQTTRISSDSPIASSTQDAESTNRRLRDDFGRIVRIDFPHHGPRIAQYDEADHIKRTVFADGAKVEYEHDAAGRMTGKVVTGPDGARESVTTLRYHGAYLIEVVDPAQTTAYRYDSSGRQVETRITLVGPAGTGRERVYTIGTVLDVHGQPIAHRLADGRTMIVERDTATQLPTALALKAQGLQPAQPIVSAISAHPFNGITGFINGNGLATTRNYDNAGRLTGLSTAGVVDLRYDYTAGPRIRSIRSGDVGKNAQSVVGTLGYDGFGALRRNTSANESSKVPPPRPAVMSASLRNTAVAERAVDRDSRGRLIADDKHLYRYDALDRLVAVEDRAQGKLIANYTYNAFGERVSKTTTDAQGRQATRQFLYQRNKLVAEITTSEDGTARVERQYIYLNSAPVAVLEADRVLAIHTDHRGAPLAMTDAQRRVVWQATYRDAWGEVQAVQAPTVDVPQWKGLLHKASAGRLGQVDHGAAQMNLRLPGQYADEETGLHYNMHRYYDPRGSVDSGELGLRRVSFNSGVHGQGRYLTPDPLGYPDGPDPYLYASGDPVNKIDPRGLYEEDVHYYLTYFLALVAGLTEQQALVIALANRYIDDNPFTEPFGRLGGNVWARRLYHFTEDGTDPAPLPGDVTVIPGYWIIGPLGPEWVSARNVYSASYIDRRMRNPAYQQLGRLRGYAVNARTPCAKAQFYGEYLHAYMDTFAHRDEQNVPYGYGQGHLPGGHSPDKTYNHSTWQVNEARTLAMEQNVFAGLQRDFGRQAVDTGGFPIQWSDIQITMVAFNRDTSQPDGSDTFSVASSKIRILNERLGALGLPLIPRYDRDLANRCRIANLKDAQGRPLNPAAYPRAILETENAAALSDALCSRS